MEVFTAASHHDVFKLVLQVAILLFAARAMGELAQRLNQPTVVGEILAGIILGPTVLSTIFPAFGHLLLPQAEQAGLNIQGYLLEVVSLIGAMFLLLITGLETDLRLIKRHARTAIGVSVGGILVTFSSGYLLGHALPDSLLGDPSKRLTFALFVGTAMSISAIPVIAKVMMDLNLMRRDIGQTIIAAGMSDDTTGWILLSIVAGLAAGDAVTLGSVAQAVGSVMAFMVLSFTAGRWLVKKLLDFVQDNVQSKDRLLTLVVILTFAWGAITQALHLEAVLGAFVMGILFGTMPRLPEEVHHKLESIALAVFTPIFFAVAGLKVNLLNIFDFRHPQLIFIALAVIAVASVGKVLGTYLGARLVGGRDHWTALAFGAGLNARGAMEIIIATIGLQLGILTQDMFSIIVLMALSTSLMAPTALRFVLSKVTMSDEESKRLRQEELASESLIANMDRVLLPVRRRLKGDNFSVQRIEKDVIGKMNEDVALTLMTIAQGSERAQSNDYLNKISEVFNGRDINRKVVEGKYGDAVDLILDEAQKDYDLIILGAAERAADQHTVFNSVVDEVMRLAPCATMVVKAPNMKDHWPPRSILVPTNGSASSRSAAEVAFTLARGTAMRVKLLNVIDNTIGRGYAGYGQDALHERRYNNAHNVVDKLRELGESQEVWVESEVRTGANVPNVILEVAERQGFDLIVLGTDLRPGSERLFLGQNVEKILDESVCPVIIFNAAT